MKESIVRPLVARSLLGVVLSLWLTILCVADEQALPERFGIGREPDASEIEQWDIDITPSGDNLPAGQGTVDRGETIYTQLCLACHGPEGAGGINDQLVSHFNPEDDLAGDTSLPRTVGNFWPYATTLYDYINRSMPMAIPGTLTADEVYSLVAYLLHLNDIVEEDAVIDAETLPSIEMPARHLFYWSDEAQTLTDRDNP